MWRRPLNNAILATTTHRKPKKVSDGISTQVRVQMINKCRIKMIQRSYIMWKALHEEGMRKIEKEHCSNLNHIFYQFIIGRSPRIVSPLISESLVRVWLSFNSVSVVIQLIENCYCRISICGPNSKIWGMLIQWAQNNKFVESGVKNWAFVNWTTTSMTLKGQFNITIDTSGCKFPLRGGSPYTKINQNWVSL